MGAEVTTTVLVFFKTEKMLKGVNTAIITLIQRGHMLNQYMIIDQSPVATQYIKSYLRCYVQDWGMCFQLRCLQTKVCL